MLSIPECSAVSEKLEQYHPWLQFIPHNLKEGWPLHFYSLFTGTIKNFLLFKFLPKYPLKCFKMFLMSLFVSTRMLLGWVVCNTFPYTFPVSLGVGIPFSWTFPTLLRSSLASLIHSVWALHLLHSSHGLSSSCVTNWLVLCFVAWLPQQPVQGHGKGRELWCCMPAATSEYLLLGVPLESGTSSFSSVVLWAPHYTTDWIISDAVPRVWRDKPGEK